MPVVWARRGLFQSTPPVKAATTSPSHLLRSCFISIHAAREGGDVAVSVYFPEVFHISIHAAREGGDPLPEAAFQTGWRFQSTPPVKAATNS